MVKVLTSRKPKSKGSDAAGSPDDSKGFIREFFTDFQNQFARELSDFVRETTKNIVVNTLFDWYELDHNAHVNVVEHLIRIGRLKPLDLSFYKAHRYMLRGMTVFLRSGSNLEERETATSVIFGSRYSNSDGVPRFALLDDSIPIFLRSGSSIKFFDNDGAEEVRFPSVIAAPKGTFDLEAVLEDMTLRALEKERAAADSATLVHSGRFYVRVLREDRHRDNGDEYPLPGLITNKKRNTYSSAPDLASEEPTQLTQSFIDASLVGKWDVSMFKSACAKKRIDAFSLDSYHEVIIDDLSKLLSQQSRMKARGIPWKRGYLFFGEPGTGKSSFTFALAEHFGLPLYMIDLNGMSVATFQEAMEKVQISSPCFLLFEDIDVTFHGRMDVRAGSANSANLVNINTLFNALDGVASTEGVITIVTTNNVSAIDPALGAPLFRDAEGEEQPGPIYKTTRPGRLDRAIEFQCLSDSGRQKMAARILGGLLTEEAIAEFMERQQDCTGSQFQNACIEEAWRQFNPLED